MGTETGCIRFSWQPAVKGPLEVVSSLRRRRRNQTAGCYWRRQPRVWVGELGSSLEDEELSCDMKWT